MTCRIVRLYFISGIILQCPYYRYLEHDVFHQYRELVSFITPDVTQFIKLYEGIDSWWFNINSVSMSLSIITYDLACNTTFDFNPPIPLNHNNL